MEISNVNQMFYVNQYYPNNISSKENFEISNETEENKLVQTPLSYYKNLCSTFSNISFRLDDSSKDVVGEVNLGYGNSMNQIGDNFGNPGQYSISIDVSVINRMMESPEYENMILHKIDNIRSMYPQYEQENRKEGLNYMCVQLNDVGGKLEVSQLLSSNPFSTEEQIKEMWGNDSLSNQFVKKIQNVQNDMFDTYMKMTEQGKKSIEKQSLE